MAELFTGGKVEGTVETSSTDNGLTGDKCISDRRWQAATSLLRPFAQSDPKMQKNRQSTLYGTKMTKEHE